jgi:hypothetical protein
MKLKPGDMVTRVSCNLTAMCGNINILMNMVILLAGSHCHDKHRISVKWAVVWDLTDTRGKWTNLTTWWTIVHYHMPSNWTRKLFFKLWNLTFSIVLSFTPQETGRVPHAQTTRQETAPSISQLNRLDSRHKKTRTFGREENWVPCCVPLQTKKQEQNSSVLNGMWVCMLAHVSRCSIGNWISEDQFTLKWKSRTDRHKWMLPSLLLNGYFSLHFPDETAVVKRMLIL